jgi:bifunctional DNA-binding transcriptional regulator/antitoxin component of YhaV-PrlF toxin-antitoxin module
MKFKPAADIISTKNIYRNSHMARTAAPTNKKATKAKSESATPVEKIVPLTGKALKAKVKELSNLTKSETAKGCGYYSVAKNGKIRVNLRKFYDAVLQSQGISIDEKTKVDGRGREANYRATVHKNGQILIGAAYTRALNLVPGDEFEIKMGYKHINLKAIDKKAEA